MPKVAILFLLVSIFSRVSLAMNLQEFLSAVSAKNKSLQSYSTSAEAAQERRVAEDISLVPILTAGASYLSDKSPLGQFAALGATQTEATSFNLGLSKKFSSGTDVSLTSSASEIENQGTLFVPGFDKFATGSLGISINQSLWKDSFGRATRLRWERLDASTEAQVGTFNLQKKALLVEAESAYWDYIYQSENVKLGLSSLERAKRIENWTRRRTANGISERADLYSAQALVAARQLQLVSAQDDLAAAQRKIRDFLELTDAEAFPAINGDIKATRSLSSFVEGQGQKVMALDAYLASLNAKAMSLASKETEDAYRPDLVLSGSYNTNSYEADMSRATEKWSDTSRPTMKVGVNFVYAFDTNVKSSAKSAARKEALAAQLQSERKLLESESAWIELNRRYTEMNRRVEAATRMSELQGLAARSQSDLFNKGRSITANVITAEEDAADADLSLIKLLAEQRKMEAQARLFVAVEGR